jgi:hypothetical protein
MGFMAKRLLLALGFFEERTRKRTTRDKRHISSSNCLLMETDLGFAREKRLPAIARGTEIRSEAAQTPELYVAKIKIARNLGFSVSRTLQILLLLLLLLLWAFQLSFIFLFFTL